MALLLICLAIAPELGNEPNEGLLTASAELPVVPYFEFRTARGELLLSGHTVSAQHENELSDIAADLFPDKTITTNFEPLGIVPGYWQDATSNVLYTLAAASSAHAELRAERVHIRGVFVDEIRWRARFSAVRHSCAGAVLLSTRIVSCDTVRFVGKINFEMSSTDFQNSAIPRLARVTAIAAICRDALIRITGHTDASGPESWNQRLSFGRANAVADYLVGHGIDRTRLQLVGAGSSVAVADNSSNYGRGLNRRIDIEFTVPAQ